MKKLKVFMPFEDYNYIGGPATFASNLRAYFKSKGYSYSNSMNSSKILFFSISHNLFTVLRYKFEGGKVVQRLDGAYDPLNFPEYKSLNNDMRIVYLYLSDHVVFQSKYSRDQCFKLFGKKKRNDFTTIINGVNNNIFYPSSNKINPNAVNFVTTGNFRHVGMLEPIIKALDLLRENLSFNLNVVGPINDSKLRPLISRNYIKLHGSKSIKAVSDILRSSDIFLFSYVNPACPNSVLEAVSTALPVVSFDSGSLKELLPFSKDLLAGVNSNFFHKYNDFNHLKLLEKIKLLVNKYDYFKEVALKNASLYSLEKCGEKYVGVFNKVLSDKREKRTLLRGFYSLPAICKGKLNSFIS